MNSSRRIAPEPPPASFGLLSWLGETRLVLPLKAVDCRFEVCGPAAHIEIDQVFHQDNPEAIDCTYTFPLPGNAAAYRCEIEVNGRVIVARVEEQERARAIFEAKKAEGRRVAMAQAERENVFTLELGNVQPGDLIVVRFAYFQSLDRAGDGLALNIPFCPGVRYIPGEPLIRSNRGRGTADDTNEVPDASRISPPRIDQYHRDAAILLIRGRLATAGPEFVAISSPSHPILVEAREAGSARVELARQGQVPDRDFVLRWQEARAEKSPRSRAWGFRGKDGFAYALAELVAPAEVEVSAADERRDVYFLLDRSGSMQGAKWDKTCEAFLAALRLLRPADRAWATLFDDARRDLAEAPLAPGALLSDRAILNVRSIGTGGGTQMGPALLHVLAAIKKHTRAKGRAVLILITDAQVGNDSSILEILQGQPVTVHTFGIDTAVNDALLRDIAEQHGGACVLMTPDDDIVSAVSALGERLRRPVLTDLQVSEGWDLADAQVVPNLSAGATVTILARGTRERSPELAVTGRSPDGKPRTIGLAIEDTESRAIELLWVKSRIRKLQRSGSQKDQAQAITLACSSNVLCRGAAFIAWDEAERVAVAGRELYQPAMVPPALGARPTVSCRGFGPADGFADFLCAPRKRSLFALPLPPAVSMGVAEHGPSDVPPKLLADAKEISGIKPDDDAAAIDVAAIRNLFPDFDFDLIAGRGASGISRRWLNELADQLLMGVPGGIDDQVLLRFFLALAIWQNAQERFGLDHLAKTYADARLRELLRFTFGFVAIDRFGKAYELLLQARIPGMDTLIASAFVHFCARPAAPWKPQIFDKLAVHGLRETGAHLPWLPKRSHVFQADVYENYCQCLHHWALALGCTAEQIECYLRRP